jgi:hypothetical protein
MKSICSLLYVFLLSSCVHYSTTHEIGNDPKSSCSSGSAKENKKCRAEIKKVNESIESRGQR